MEGHFSPRWAEVPMAAEEEEVYIQTDIGYGYCKT